MTERKTCFVVQGFGEKTDLATGRTLNLDASYEVIKEAVETAGLRCVRADEIVHSGTIDEPMYEALFRADLVIADLSTGNLNAAYELGVRYGVRPRATIIVAEEQFKNPFDFSHIVMRRYEHLGKDLGRKEASRFVAELSAAIKTIVEGDAVDSPVYTFLRLDPPSAGAVPRGARGGTRAAAAPTEQNARQLLGIARDQLATGRFAAARAVLESVAELRPRDPFVIQQLALATYKAAEPDPRSALRQAQALLQTLDPGITNDPETLGLWGAVHKRLWDLDADASMLDVAISSYERGFYLKQDSYNGINLAYLLNVRAVERHKAGDRLEAIADFVLARRVRRDVAGYCTRVLSEAVNPDDKFWAVATLWEAAVGTGDRAAAEKWSAKAAADAPAAWMLDSARAQLARLDALLVSSNWITAA